MGKCPECGILVGADDIFCSNCGSSVKNFKPASLNEEKSSNFSTNNFNKDNFSHFLNEYVDYSKNKSNKGLIFLAYLSVIVELILIFTASYSVRIVNSDRIMLYPLLALILAFYFASKLFENEDSRIHGAIVTIVSFLLFIFVAIAIFI